MASEGCGDNSCVIAKPTGRGTNGGCRCPEWKLRAEIVRLCAVNERQREVEVSLRASAATVFVWLEEAHDEVARLSTAQTDRIRAVLAVELPRANTPYDIETLVAALVQQPQTSVEAATYLGRSIDEDLDKMRNNEADRAKGVHDGTT